MLERLIQLKLLIMYMNEGPMNTLFYLRWKKIKNNIHLGISESSYSHKSKNLKNLALLPVLKSKSVLKHTTFHTKQSKSPYKNSDFGVKLHND